MQHLARLGLTLTEVDTSRGWLTSTRIAAVMGELALGEIVVSQPGFPGVARLSSALVGGGVCHDVIGGSRSRAASSLSPRRLSSPPKASLGVAM